MGGLSCDPVVEGGCRPWLGLVPCQPRQRANPPWVQAALDSGYSLGAPLFASPKVAYITLRRAFRRLLRHPIWNKGVGGVWRYTGGAWPWKSQPGNPVSRIPEPIGAGHLTQSKVFTGACGALVRGSDWELCFLNWEEKRVGEGSSLGAQLGVHPMVGIHFGGVYDPWQEASYNRPVEDFTITRPIKTLGRASRPQAAPRPLGAPPRAPLTM